jgi:lipoprotein signal peptidase
MVVLWLTRKTVWRIPALLVTAAGLGNGLPEALPPHTIVDFIYSAPLAHYLGHCVMNVADLYWDAGLLGFIVLAVRATWLHVGMLRNRMRE